MPASKALVTPGFWDLHLHGVAGIDFMHASIDEMAHACESLGRRGTGAFAPTLLTAESRLLRTACTRWGLFLERCEKPGFLPRGSAVPIGLHLEGPFLSPEMAGAHPEMHLRKPSVSWAEDLLASARGRVAIMTVAPELPGASVMIERLVKRGVRVQLGHSKATTAEALRAAALGATGLTHLYNAMRIHHREPGLLAPLQKGLVTAEVITDGIHLDPTFIAWLSAAAPDRLYAVSDGCAAVGARKGARLTLGSLSLRKSGRAAVVAGSGILAGGATFLTEHPATLRAHAFDDGSPARMMQTLRMYFAIQRQTFPRTARRVRLQNHFNAKTLRFLGSESS